MNKEKRSEGYGMGSFHLDRLYSFAIGHGSEALSNQWPRGKISSTRLAMKLGKNTENWRGPTDKTTTNNATAAGRAERPEINEV